MKKQKNFHYMVADKIINARFFVVLAFIILSVFSAYKVADTVVQNDLTVYLSEDTKTRTGLEVMSENFSEITLVSFMIHTTDSDVVGILTQNEDITIVSISEETDGYTLYSLSFDSATQALQGKDFIEENFENTEFYISSLAFINSDEYLADEMQIALLLAVIVIIAVLLFTSASFAEIPILLTVFTISAIIAMGTNFIYDEISYISNSVAVILQLALAIDYALVFIHRNAEERKEDEAEMSSKLALSKAIPEVFASSFTTICGFISLSFMSYQIGSDMAMVLIKSILISLATVFLLLPALVVIFDKAIQKTTHRNFVPSVGTLIEKTINIRKWTLPIFLILAVLSFNFSSKSEYTFSANNITLQGDADTKKIQSVFDTENTFVLLTPVHESTSAFIDELETLEKIDSISSYETFEIIDNITLFTEVNYVVVAQMLSLDTDTTLELFGGYASTNEELELFYQDVNAYQVPVLTLIEFLEMLANSGELPPELVIELMELSSNVEYLKSQFISTEYNRILISTTLPVEGAETFEFIENLQDLTDNYFSNAHIVSESLSSYELHEVFSSDKLVVNGLSALFIAIILLCSFKSLTSAIAMIFCIQTAINLNFAIPYFQNTSLFFIGYLVVVAIQMGATIDYAIVIANRYNQLLGDLTPKEAIKQAVDKSFSTILSSGSVLSITGFILSKVSSDFVISSLGSCLARGTFISILLVLFVLPSLLLTKTKTTKTNDILCPPECESSVALEPYQT